MDIKLLFTDQKYLNLEDFTSTTAKTDRVTVKEQVELLQSLQKDINSFEDYKDGANFVNNRLQKNPVEAEIISRLFPGQNIRINNSSGINPYWNKGSYYEKLTDKNNENSTFVDHNALKSSVNFGRKERNEERDNKTGDHDPMKDMQTNVQRASTKKPVIRQRKDYIKRDKKGNAKLNKKGIPKSYGIIGKTGINVANKFIGSKAFRVVNFLIFHSKILLYSILIFIVLIFILIIGSGFSGVMGAFGHSPFALCSNSDISDIKDDSEGSSSGSNINLSNPSTNDMQTFAGVSISDSFGVSDAKAEQFFLDSKSRAVSKYGLNSSNIHDVTQAIKAQKISPTYFYAYTINEGGGEGGFINHYGRSHDSGDAVKDATDDAKYLFSTANASGGQPAWIDAGNPKDFVPQDVKNKGNETYNKLPKGTIGRAYIAATAAAAWEFFYPDGLLSSHNGVQNYGSPMREIMKTIQKLGGKPGASAVSGEVTADCSDSRNGNSAGNTGQIQFGGNTPAGKAAEWIMNKKNWNSTTPVGNAGIDFDGSFGAQCTDLTNAFWKQTGGKGRLSGNGMEIVSNNKSQLKAAGWKVIDNPKPSDIKLGSILQESPNHTEIVVGWDGKGNLKTLSQNPNSPQVMTPTPSKGSTINGTGGNVTSMAIPPDSIMNAK